MGAGPNDVLAVTDPPSVLSRDWPDKRTHGKTGTYTYDAWRAMKRRCSRKGEAACREWLHSFGAFYEDMGRRPDNTVLARKDDSGPWGPGNCYWRAKTEC